MGRFTMIARAPVDDSLHAGHVAWNAPFGNL